MFKSIKTRLIFVVTLIVFIIVAGVSVLIYNQNIDKIEQLMGKRAQSIASTGATMINGDDHKKITENLQTAGDLPEWKKLQQSLLRIKEKNFLKEDVYTMMDAYWIEKNKDNPYGMVFFTALAQSEKFEPKGQKKEKYVFDSLTKKVSGYTSIFQTINGFFITGYAPILTSKGEVTGVLEVALEVGKEIMVARRELINSISTAATGGLLVAILLVIFASQKISSPIKSLTRVVEKMATGDLEARMTDINTKDEISILGHGFNNMAENLEKSYRELEKYSLHLEDMVAERTAELAAANARITAMLDNMKLSVFSVNQNNKIEGPVSAFSSEIFNKEIVEKDIFNVLYKDIDQSDEAYSKIESSFITTFGEDEFQWELMEDELPRELTLADDSGNTQYLEVKYSPLWNEESNLEQILFVVDDVTQLKALEKEAARVKEESDRQNRILTQLSNLGPDSLESSFSALNKLLNKLFLNINNATIADTFIILHTIKGNSRVLGLDLIAQRVHEVEHELLYLKEANSLGKSDLELLKQLVDSLAVVISGYNEVASRIFKIKRYVAYPDPNLFVDLLLTSLKEDERQLAVIDSMLEESGFPVPANKTDYMNYLVNSPFKSKFLFFNLLDDAFINSVIDFHKLLLSSSADSTQPDVSGFSGIALNFYRHCLDVSTGADNNSVVTDDLLNIERLIYQLLVIDGRDPNRFLFNFTELDKGVEIIRNHRFEYGLDYKLVYDETSNSVQLESSKEIENILSPTKLERTYNYYHSHYNLLLVSLAIQVREPLFFFRDPDIVKVNKTHLDTLCSQSADLKHKLSSLERFPCEYYLKKYYPIVLELAEKNNSRIKVKIDSDSDAISLDEYRFYDQFISQLLINSAEHGIENVLDRENNHKDLIGSINIKFVRHNDYLSLDYADDGIGIDFNQLRVNLENGDSMGDEEVFEHLLSQSLSTKDSATIYSGMGEGLSVLGKAKSEKIINLSYFFNEPGFHIIINKLV